MHITLVRSIRTVAALTWALALADLVPWRLHLQPDAQLVVIALACVSTYTLIHLASARPAEEVYLAGKAMGRLEAEAEARASMSRVDSRRLRVVGRDDS